MGVKKIDKILMIGAEVWRAARNGFPDQGEDVITALKDFTSRVESRHRIVPLHRPSVEPILVDEEVNYRPISDTGEVPLLQFQFMSGDGCGPMIISREKNRFLIEFATHLNQKTDKSIFIREWIRTGPVVRVPGSGAHTPKCVEGIDRDAMPTQFLDDAQAVVMAVEDERGGYHN